MHQLMLLFKSAMTALVSTLGIATISIIFVMFTTREPGVRRTGLFDGVFFESVDKGDGSLRLGVGVNDALPLIFIRAFLTVIIFAGCVFYKKSPNHKKSLESTQDNDQPLR